MPQSIEKSYGFFDAEEKDCARLKSSRISGRRADWRVCFFSQYAYWEKKRNSGAHVAGID